MPIRKPKLRFSITCDDIRHEVGNKLSFMGVYGKDIVLSKIPLTFPKLCVALFYENLAGGDYFSIKGTDPSGKQIGNIVSGSVPEGEKGKITLTITAIFGNITIDEEGTFKIMVVFNDDEKTKEFVEIPIKIRK